MFSMDPVAVLDEKNTMSRQIRDAAFQVWAEDQRQMMSGSDDDVDEVTYE